MALDLSCTNEEQVRVKANPATASGNPSALDGALRVTVISGDGFAVPGNTPDEVVFVSGAAEGVSVCLVEGDGDLTSGERLISETVTLNVSAAAASNLGLAQVSVEPKAVA
jgi:hypothetical protein